MSSKNLPRICHASSSRLVLPSPSVLPLRRFAAIPPRPTEPTPFFGSPFKSNITLTPQGYPVSYGLGRNKGKGKAPGPPEQDEEVDDREWEMRSARAMLHLRNTLPRFFDADQSTSTLFPSDIFSPHMVLKLHHPFPLKVSAKLRVADFLNLGPITAPDSLQVSSLSGYSLAFALARNGMQALHSDLQTSLERITYSQSPKEVLSPADSALLARKPIPAHRQKQIRVAVAVYATIRLPPHSEAVWKTSSLYTICPRTGLIASHEVESIRPLPGEGVAEWLKTRLLGWTGHAKHHEGLHDGEVPCPRTVPLPAENELARLRKAHKVDVDQQGKRNGHDE